jgi:hypothetical protein
MPCQVTISTALQHLEEDRQQLRSALNQLEDKTRWHRIRFVIDLSLQRGSRQQIGKSGSDSDSSQTTEAFSRWLLPAFNPCFCNQLPLVVKRVLQPVVHISVGHAGLESLVSPAFSMVALTVEWSKPQNICSPTLGPPSLGERGWGEGPLAPLLWEKGWGEGIFGLCKKFSLYAGSLSLDLIGSGFSSASPPAGAELKPNQVDSSEGF